MKTPTGAAWRPDAIVCSPEGSRGSRRPRTCRCVLRAQDTPLLLTNMISAVWIHASGRSAPAPAAGQTYQAPAGPWCYSAVPDVTTCDNAMFNGVPARTLRKRTCSVIGGHQRQQSASAVLLAAGATLVLLGVCGPRSTAREHAASPALAVHSAERGAPTLLGAEVLPQAGAGAVVCMFE